MASQHFQDSLPSGNLIVRLEAAEMKLGQGYECDGEILPFKPPFGLRVTPEQKNHCAGVGDGIRAHAVHGTCSNASAMSFSNLSQSCSDIS